MKITSEQEAIEAAVELMKRKRSQTSLHSFALNVDIPGAPMVAMCPDEDLIGDAKDLMARIHSVILEHVERTMNTPYGRLMVFAPPGSAKSSYVSVVAPAWDASRPRPTHPNAPPMWREGDGRIIIASYADKIAQKQSRRIQQICGSPRYRHLWDEPVMLDREAVGDWSLSNRCEFLAAGIMGGITGNRAHGVIIDDPVAGREEADSDLVRQKTIDGYNDDVMTRLLPGAYVILIQTRWHEMDLAGQILPDDYDGRSGWVMCKDGMPWYILNIPAKAERGDDPLGRQPGEYMWPEWFTPQHWAMYENGTTREQRRTWSSLYQQRPTPEGSGDFKRSDFNWYDSDELPVNLHLVGASDYAVTKDAGDFSEHGIGGLDSDGNLWFVDWWSGQTETDVSIAAFISMLQRYNKPNEDRKINMWCNEGGVIDKAVRPTINKAMREAREYVDLRTLPSIQDKRAKCKAFGALVSAGAVWLPRGQAWAEDLVDQLCAMPAGRYDDKADVAGLMGRMIDKFIYALPEHVEKKTGIVPFSAEWLEYTDEAVKQAVRYH
jgi:predicted phage terminase large subunit-like protein